jgi:hypothetical protein
LTGAYRFDPRVKLIWTADLGSGDPGQARAAGSGAQPAATWGAAALRRLAAARRGNGAGVHRLLRGFRQNDEHPRAKTTASSRSGGEAPGRRTASGRIGATPATLTQRRRARRREQKTPTGSLPRGGTAGDLEGDGPAPDRRNRSGGRLGFGSDGGGMR